MRISDWSSDVCSSDLQVGTLVSADPLAETPPGVQAWRVRYWTSSQDSQRQEVTGMVVAPREAMPAQPRHVIAWTHGTWGVAEKCAPSISPDFFTATPMVEAMIARGYVVVAPDYRSEEHTSELQSLMRISYAVFCLTKKKH